MRCSHAVSLALSLASCVSTPRLETPQQKANVERILARPLAPGDAALLRAVEELEQGFSEIRSQKRIERNEAFKDIFAAPDLPGSMTLAALALKAFDVLQENGARMTPDVLWTTVCEHICSAAAVAPLVARIPPEARREWFRKKVLTETHFTLAGKKRSDWLEEPPAKATEKEETAPPLPPDLEALKAAVRDKNWGRAKTLAEKIVPSESAATCDAAYLYAHFIDAQWSRRLGKRGSFYALQKQFVGELEASACTSSDFRMSAREFAELKADAMLWLARLLWERNEDLARASALTEKARALATTHELGDLLLEAAQVQVGRLGFELETASGNLKILDEYDGISQRFPKLGEWITLRRALFLMLDGRPEDAIGYLDHMALAAAGDKTTQAQALFWKGRALQSAGKETEARAAFLEAGRLDPLGYYDVVSGEALGAPSKHASLSEVKSLLKGSPQMAQKTLETGPEASPHPFLQVPAELFRKEMPSDTDDAASAGEAVAPPIPPFLLLAAHELAKQGTYAKFAAALQVRSSVTAHLAYAEAKTAAAELPEKAASGKGTEEARLKLLGPAVAWVLHAAGDHLSSIPMADRARNRISPESPLADAVFTMLYPSPFAADFRNASARCGVEENLAIGLARQESLFDPKALSSAGAVGLMQLLPSTARRIFSRFPELAGQDEATLLRNPHANTLAGSCYLGDLLKRYQGSPWFAAAAYNAGEAAVDGWIARRNRWNDIPLFVEFIPFGETQKYVQRVIRNLRNMEIIYSGEPQS